MKVSESPRVVFSSPYVPPEWVAAHGWQPSRVVPTRLNTDGPVPLTQGVCPYLRGFANEACAATDVDLLVLTTVCDQTRRAAEWVARRSALNVFLLNLPATWQTDGARALYRREIERLGRFLASHGGVVPDNERLAAVMSDFDEKRERLRALSGRIDARDFSTRLAEFARTGRISDTGQADGTSPPLPGVAIVGGPMTAQTMELFDLVEEQGGRVVLDATETGERTMPPRFDRGRTNESPLEALVDAYFMGIQDVFRRPNTEVFGWIERELRKRAVDGVLLLRYVWCDLWHAEVHRMRERLNVPVVDIDLNEEHPIARHTTRVQAFMEALRER